MWNECVDRRRRRRGIHEADPRDACGLRAPPGRYQKCPMLRSRMSARRWSSWCWSDWTAGSCAWAITRCRPGSSGCSSRRRTRASPSPTRVSGARLVSLRGRSVLGRHRRRPALERSLHGHRFARRGVGHCRHRRRGQGPALSADAARRVLPERQRILQLAREQALEHERLVRQIQELRKPSRALRGLVADLVAAPSTGAPRAQVERMAAT